MAKRIGKLLIAGAAIAAVAGTLYYLIKQEELEEALSFDDDEEDDPYDYSYEGGYSGDGDHSFMNFGNGGAQPEDTASENIHISDENSTSLEKEAVVESSLSYDERLNTEDNFVETPESSKTTAPVSAPSSPEIEEFFDDEV